MKLNQAGYLQNKYLNWTISQSTSTISFTVPEVNNGAHDSEQGIYTRQIPIPTWHTGGLDFQQALNLSSQFQISIKFFILISQSREPKVFFLLLLFESRAIAVLD